MKATRGLMMAANWKMNHGNAATTDFFRQYRAREGATLSEGTRAAIQRGLLAQAIFPSASTFHAAATEARTLSQISLGAQNVHWKDQGAFTGEISVSMCREDFGMVTALVGHSERRQFFGETDASARLRALHLAQSGMNQIFCIGETRGEREAGKAQEVLESQIRSLWEGTPPELKECALRPWKTGVGPEKGRWVLAYEPVWAIGTGLTASPEQAQEAHSWIRKSLAQYLGVEGAERVWILYGGSVTPANLGSLLGQADIDGALVGGASLKVEGWLELLEIAGKKLSG